MKSVGKNLALFACLCLAVVLEATFFDFVKICDTKPDLLLMLVVSSGLFGGYVLGGVSGLVGGLLLGFLSCGSQGAYVLAYGLTGVLSALPRERMRVENPLVVLLAGITGTLVSSFSILGLSFLLGIISSPLTELHHVPPLVVWNAVLIVPVALVLKRWLLGERPASRIKV